MSNVRVSHSARWRRARALWRVGLVAALFSCSDSTGPDECLANVTLQINVFVDPEPRFEWVPRCRISELVVFDEGTGETMWSLFSAGGSRPNTLRSGIEYGVVPDDADEEAPAQLLVPGTTYRVTLSATNNGSVDAIGTRTFVR
jgi:hypothetical protein